MSIYIYIYIYNIYIYVCVCVCVCVCLYMAAYICFMATTSERVYFIRADSCRGESREGAVWGQETSFGAPKLHKYFCI